MFGAGAPNQPDLALMTLRHVSSFTCTAARARSAQVTGSVTNTSSQQ